METKNDKALEKGTNLTTTTLIEIRQPRRRYRLVSDYRLSPRAAKVPEPTGIAIDRAIAYCAKLAATLPTASVRSDFPPTVVTLLDSFDVPSSACAPQRDPKVASRHRVVHEIP